VDGAVAHRAWRHSGSPAGWLDLSAGRPAPSDLPAHDLAVAAASQAYAVDPATAATGYSTTMMAKVVPQALVPDEKTLGEVITGFAQGIHAQSPDAGLSIVERGIVDLQGVPAMRIVADLTSPRKRLRLVQFVVPGGDSTAVLVYTAAPQAFARNLSLFEANARTVEGAGAAPFGAQVGHWLGGTWLGDLKPEDRTTLFKGVGEVLGIVVFVILARVLQRRKRVPTA
jgi:hypothetical protein